MNQYRTQFPIKIGAKSVASKMDLITWNIWSLAKPTPLGGTDTDCIPRLTGYEDKCDKVVSRDKINYKRINFRIVLLAAWPIAPCGVSKSSRHYK